MYTIYWTTWLHGYTCNSPWSRLAFYPSPDTELRSYQRVIICAEEPSILRRLWNKLAFCYRADDSNPLAYWANHNNLGGVMLSMA